MPRARYCVTPDNSQDVTQIYNSTWSRFPIILLGSVTHFTSLKHLAKYPQPKKECLDIRRIAGSSVLEKPKHCARVSWTVLLALPPHSALALLKTLAIEYNKNVYPASMHRWSKTRGLLSNDTIRYFGCFNEMGVQIKKLPRGPQGGKGERGGPTG